MAGEVEFWWDGWAGVSAGSKLTRSCLAGWGVEVVTVEVERAWLRDT